MVFLFLAVVGQFVGEIKVPKERQVWAGLIGVLLLFTGIALYVIPASLSVATPTVVAAAPDTPTAAPIVPTDTPTQKLPDSPMPEPPTNTPVPEPTDTPLSPTDTPTPKPTNTPHPTSTPAATSTAVPTPSIPLYDDFEDGGIASSWYDAKYEGVHPLDYDVTESGGVLRFKATNNTALDKEASLLVEAERMTKAVYYVGHHTKCYRDCCLRVICRGSFELVFLADSNRRDNFQFQSATLQNHSKGAMLPLYTPTWCRSGWDSITFLC